mmetsp:Transcript_33832/g.71118  ORF Transcript_33832/g.71118 Transcript_33832/m.71118 type:complete len:229 (+) Transcript_33832:1446-2132(+)
MGDFATVLSLLDGASSEAVESSFDPLSSDGFFLASASSAFPLDDDPALVSLSALSPVGISLASASASASPLSARGISLASSSALSTRCISLASVSLWSPRGISLASASELSPSGISLLSASPLSPRGISLASAVTDSAPTSSFPLEAGGSSPSTDLKALSRWSRSALMLDMGSVPPNMELTLLSRSGTASEGKIFFGLRPPSGFGISLKISSLGLSPLPGFAFMNSLV